MTLPLVFFWFAVVAFAANAQTVTVVNGNGETVIQVLTTDLAGVPTTSILSTLSPVTTATTQITPTPPAQQGPVGQPAPTSTLPNGVIPYTYTTVVGGVTTAIADTFTPTDVATIRPTVGANGTIMDYSSWLSVYSPKTTSLNRNAALSVRFSIIRHRCLFASTAILSVVAGSW